MTHRSTLIALAILALAGCRVPPEAPAEIDDLTTYLYENHDDEDPLVLAAGVDSFVTWLDENFETLDDKYSITPLSEETVDSLDDEDRTSEGLIGLAVVTTSEHSVEDAAFANTAVSIEEVYGDQYTDYTREVVGDVEIVGHRPIIRARLGAMDAQGAQGAPRSSGISASPVVRMLCITAP